MKLFRYNPPHITEAQSDDIPFLAGIHADSFGHAWSEEDILSTLNTKGSSCIVAKPSGLNSDNLSGFLIFRVIAEQAEILTIAVDPKYRKRGIANALMDYTVRKLHADRVAGLFLEVSEANKPALALYHSKGFKQISIRKSYYTSKSLPEEKSVAEKTNALVMQLELR